LILYNINVKEDKIMSKKVKHIISLVFAAIALAVGVAVVVLSILDEGVTTNEMIKLLGIAVFCLGILAINNVSKEK